MAFLLDEQAGLCRSSKHGGQQGHMFMDISANHMHSWMQIAVLILRYADLLARTEKHFRRPAGFLDLSTEPSLIRQAVANTRFAKLQAKA